jgi:tRNA(fMet)-specific endonuclease VapC
LLKDVTVLDLTLDVAHTFGSLRAQQLDTGKPAPALDLLIAATAVHHGLTLVTHNVRDYANVPGLSIEDWLAP